MTEHTAHAVPTRTYLAVFVALLALTALTTWAAYWSLGAYHGGPLHDVIALAIAGTKATLVILFFMHVRHATGLTRLFIIAGLFWLAILMTLTLADIFTRTRAMPGLAPSGQDTNHLYISPGQ